MKRYRGRGKGEKTDYVGHKKIFFEGRYFEKTPCPW